MSVIVKGMEMPENCMSCPFPSVGVDWYYCYCPGVDGKAYDFEQSKTVPDDCPLIALPDKHGRLVDADALIEQMEADAEHMDEPYARMIYSAAISDVRHAPTIVEAEGENG